MHFLGIAILIVDQLVKLYVKANMMPGESIPVIKDVFHITYVLNSGAAFGMLKNQHMFFIIVAVIMIVLAIKYYHWIREQDIFFRYGLVVTLWGAIGNLIDRIQTGLVVDFLDFRIWPVFNVADIAITCGVAVMIYALIFRMKEI